MKKMLAVLLATVFMTVAAPCSASENLYYWTAQYNIEASVYDFPEFDAFIELPRDEGIYFACEYGSSTVSYFGASMKEIDMAFVLVPDPGEMGDALYQCLAICDTMLETKPSDVAGWIMLSFKLAARDRTTYPYITEKGQAIMQRTKDGGVIFTCQVNN